MSLNVWESIRNFFINLFNNFSWGSAFLLIAGIIIGLMIAGLIYLIVTLRSIKKASDMNELDKVTDEDKIAKTKEVVNIINGYKDEFTEEGRDLTIMQKIDSLKSIIMSLVKDIATVYYPDSKYPLYELKIEEVIELVSYIDQKIDKTFDGKILSKIKEVKISTIFEGLEVKKKLDDSKIVKASKKAHLGSAGKVILGAINVINPVYWIKKATTSAIVNIGGNNIAEIIIDIVGNETAKIYSKNLFNKDKEIELEIEEINTEEKEEE